MSSFPSLFGDGLPKYKYTPVPPGAARTFRLARLLPPEPSLIPGLEPTIRISLLECEAAGGSAGQSTAAATASIEYDALSYAWDVPPGAKRPTRRIIVETGGEGRFSLLIYRPLERALLRFAAANAKDEDETGGQGPRYDLPMFIDQICINQEDDGEKAQQVLLMQAIYTHARRAVVWLGPGTASSDAWYAYVRALCADGVIAGVMSLPFASIMRIYDGVVRPASAAAPLADPGETRDRDDLLALTEGFASRYPIAGYLAVLRRSWFSRLWTIQEACLARDVVMVCGDAVLCFDCFRAGMFFYTVQNNYWVSRFSGPLPREEMLMRTAAFDATEGFNRIYQERKAIHRGRDGGQHTPLHELVIKHGLVSKERWKVGASLAQDRIYALLGLAAADDPVKARLGIYYDKEDQARAQVRAYTEATGLFLEQGRMDVLLFNQLPKKTEGLPSWVPDWAMDLVLPVAWQALHQPAFAAGGSSQVAAAALPKADVAAGSISVTGVPIGRVAAIGQATYKAEDDPQFLEQIRYSDAKLMFDEVDSFVHSALTNNAAAAAAATPPSPETLAHTSLRVYDSGLLARQLITELGSPAASMQRLLTVQSSISRLGARILRSAANARAYSLFSVYATVGITPWYVDYYRATTVLHRLARGPAPLARTVVLALADLVEDVVGICVASARVWLATTRVALRRRYAPAQLNVPDARYRDVGLDPEVVRSEHMTAFLTNLERNIGRRVFRTDEGGVGMGPGAMQTGDAVVVLNGLTTPMVLRPGGTGTDEWTVVGEAYCDGVMDGEALGVDERRFVLV